MDGLDGLAQALGITDKKDADWHVLAKVSAVNPDGSLTVYMAGSLNPTSIDAYCDAQAGDVVCVLISKGKARAIARKGGVMPGIDLLWTNPNPTSSFNAQTLPIPWEGYTFIYIECYTPQGSGLDAHTETSVVPTDGTGSKLIKTTREVVFFRIVELQSGSNLYIGAGCFFGAWNTGNPPSTTANGYIIPSRIWGVR